MIKKKQNTIRKNISLPLTQFGLTFYLIELTFLFFILDSIFPHQKVLRTEKTVFYF